MDLAKLKNCNKPVKKVIFTLRLIRSLTNRRTGLTEARLSNIQNTKTSRSEYLFVEQDVIKTDLFQSIAQLNNYVKKELLK